jgi:hypothetical protein
MHPKHCHPTAHLFQAAIGFSPVCNLAEKPGKFAAVDAGVIGKKTPYKLYIGLVKFSSAISHKKYYTEKGVLCPAKNQAIMGSFFQAGETAVLSGSPFHSSVCNWFAIKIRAIPSPDLGHH